MIPTTNTLLNSELQFEEQPSKNYKMHFDLSFINGFRDELDAMTQVVYKILNTERYLFVIYSHNYGIELLDLYGEPVSYVCPEVERRITEALVQDDRINSVDDFNFDLSQKGKISVTFTVHTVFGDVEAERTVNY